MRLADIITKLEGTQTTQEANNSTYNHIISYIGRIAFPIVSAAMIAGCAAHDSHKKERFVDPRGILSDPPASVALPEPEPQTTQVIYNGWVERNYGDTPTEEVIPYDDFKFLYQLGLLRFQDQEQERGRLEDLARHRREAGLVALTAGRVFNFYDACKRCEPVDATLAFLDLLGITTAVPNELARQFTQLIAVYLPTEAYERLSEGKRDGDWVDFQDAMYQAKNMTNVFYSFTLGANDEANPVGANFITPFNFWTHPGKILRINDRYGTEAAILGVGTEAATYTGAGLWICYGFKKGGSGDGGHGGAMRPIHSSTRRAPVAPGFTGGPGVR